MNKSWPQMIIMISATIVLITGLVLVLWQIVASGFSPEEGSHLRPTGELFGVETHFVGVMVLTVGALLMIIGYLAGRPWSRNRTPQ
jgi:hypothetical protein